MKTRGEGFGEKKKKKKGRKEGEPSSPLPPPASPPPLTLLRVSSCAHACAASFVLGAEPQGLKKMGQSAPRTLLLLLAGLLGEALAGFPNTISIGKRPPRHRDPLLPPPQPPPAAGKLYRGGAGGDPGRSRLGARAAPAAGPGSLAVVVREKRGRNGARAAPAGGGERWRAAGAAALSVPLTERREDLVRGDAERWPRSCASHGSESCEGVTARRCTGVPQPRGRTSREAEGTRVKLGFWGFFFPLPLPWSSARRCLFSSRPFQTARLPRHPCP